jgi:hypothetical protein
MPEMDLGDIRSLDLTAECKMSGALGDAASRMMSYVTWPRDESRRKQYLASMGAVALGDFENKLPEAFGEIGVAYARNSDWSALQREVMEQLAERHFRPHGGFRVVANSPAIEALNCEIATKSKQTLAVGQLLYVIRCMAEYHSEIKGGASLSKAVEVMEACIDAKGALRNRSGLMAAWSEFKCVAHVCAALTETHAKAHKHGGAFAKAISEGGAFFAGLGWTLAVAHDYQQFMTGFIPHGQPKPLVSIEEALTLPAGVVLRTVKGSTGALPPKAIEAMQSYKAPKRL